MGAHAVEVEQQLHIPGGGCCTPSRMQRLQGWRRQPSPHDEWHEGRGDGLYVLCSDEQENQLHAVEAGAVDMESGVVYKTACVLLPYAATGEGKLGEGKKRFSRPAVLCCSCVNMETFYSQSRD